MSFLRISLGICLSALLVAPSAHAQQIKSRVMILLDTSGSMGLHFQDPQNGTDFPGGDGSTSYSDINLTNQFMYPGKLLGNGTRDGVNSRLYAAKSATSEAINAYGGDIDFGMMTYDFSLCAFNTPLCEQCNSSQFGYNCLYTNNAFTLFTQINFVSNGCSTNGGRILVPAQNGSGPQILPWLDGVEVHRDSGNGTPINPEIRADGSTPLARSITYARTAWYDAIKGSDPQVNCRPYALVVATDGADSCGPNGTSENTVTPVTNLYNDNTTNRVLTYVIGLAADANLQTTLNQMAAAGGTGQARFANSQADIEAAFADIAASSVKYEQCNGKDDNCNNLVDEGLGVYQECTTGTQCGSGTCNQGRCTCTSSSQCANGFTCGGGFCVPSCTVGQGACQKSGVMKCGSNGPTCCVNDGQAACTPLVAGTPQKEICNGIDDDCNGIIDDPPVCQSCTPTAEVCDGKDNNCNGLIDDNPIDVGQSCGLNLGVCKPGTTVCVNGALQCQGATGPSPETCNNLDDDCDGIVDGMTQTCYDGPNGTAGVGICRVGQQKCTAGTWGTCVGEVTPQTEICNGVDDDCNGKVDDVNGANQPCCPSGLCGTGICTAGTMQCNGGQLSCTGGQGPQAEVCNGLDDDCNGKVDDLPNIGQPCVPMNGCAGTLQCDTQKQMVVCVPGGMAGKEICNGLDDDCDGMVDEEPETSMNDSRLNQPCGNPNNLPLPCMAGKTICQNGQVVCQGAVGPMMEVCDGKDNDCDGNVDNNAPCPSMFICYNGQCDPLCGSGEFPCPGGYTQMTVNGQCICVANKTCNPPCTGDTICDPQTGTCIDRCANVVCPTGLMCDQGACYGCEHFGCQGSCTRCDRASHQCVPDKCCNVQCQGGQFCDPSTGQCVGTCPNGCPAGQTCDNGTCVQDKCAGKSCPERQACDPATGNCVADPCYQVDCGPNLACCASACVADPCAATVCPTNTTCHVNPLSCGVSCDALPEGQRDEIVGAGGGGFACSVAPGQRPTGGLFTLGLLFAALALARRKARGGRP